MFEISQIVNRDVKNGTISNPSIKMLLGGKRANPCFLTLSESSDGGKHGVEIHEDFTYMVAK